MAGITLAQAETKLQEYLDAETAVLEGQQYRYGERQLTMANLTEIRDGIKHWNDQVQQLSQRASGLGRSRTIRPNW